MTRTKKLPKRADVKLSDTWDLSTLFAADAEWEAAFQKWEKQIPKLEKFKGTLGDGPETLAKCIKFHSRFDRQAERLGNYAQLKTTEDTADSEYQRMLGRFQNAASRAGQAASFFRPEILALPASKLKSYLAAKPLAP